MKILVLQDFLRSGGTERQSVLLAGAFAAAGHETTLMTFRPGGALALPAEGGGPALPSRGSLQPFDTGLDWFAPGLAARVGRLRPDVILCMGRMANGRAGRLQGRFPKIAVIGTMRTGKPLPWAYRRSLRKVRHVVANSAEARDTLVRQYGLRAERISVIRNSLVFPASDRMWTRRPAALLDDTRRAASSTNETPGVCEELRARFGAAETATVLLSVAMFRPEKGQARLIGTVAGLPAGLDWQLWLAGSGPERAACEDLARRLELGERVKFPGFLADPRPLYAAADIAVHASSSEALSNFLIESQAHGLPAVAFDAQGIRECFLPGRTGWAVVPGDEAGFRKAVESLAAEPVSARQARADEARAFARDAFDPARQAAAYLELFAKL